MMTKQNDSSQVESVEWLETAPFDWMLLL